MIRTPDQRLRVFVSSTLQELIEERVGAREAITALRLSPVMFEMGARPHPPRDLYRASLEQSDIFVGIYWQRYGWIAPDMEISGLEDEYRLSGAKPKLIYIKAAETEREPRLKELLESVQSDGVSYKPFETEADPANAGPFKVPNFGPVSGLSLERMGDRRTLLARMDRVRRVRRLRALADLHAGPAGWMGLGAWIAGAAEQRPHESG